MNNQPFSNRLAFYGAWASVAVGAVVLAGWWMNIPVCRQLFLEAGEVKANTGLLFVIFGLVILALSYAGCFLLLWASKKSSKSLDSENWLFQLILGMMLGILEF